MPTNPAHTLAHKINKDAARTYRPSEPWGVNWVAIVVRHINGMDKTTPVGRTANTGTDTFRTKAEALAFIAESLTDPQCRVDTERNRLVFDRAG
jgi:hypothetical protein